MFTRRPLQLARYALVAAGLPFASAHAADPSAVAVFALEPGNSWNYASKTGKTTQITVSGANTTQLTRANGSTATSAFSLQDGPPAVRSMSSLVTRMLGYNINVTAANPLPVLWFPLQPGDSRTASSSINIVADQFRLTGTARMKTRVLGREIVELPFGSLVAYSVSSRLGASTRGINQSIVDHNWFVPYLGVVASGQSPVLARSSKLQSFSLKGGLFTEQTDSDEDGLKDWQELAVVGSDPQSEDTDQDDSFDAVDNCPLDANPGQDDADGDGVGDACEAVVDAKVTKGTLIDATATGRDSVSATLVQCDGPNDRDSLADAVLRMADDTAVTLTVGSEAFELSGADFNARTLKASFGDGKGTVNLIPLRDTLTIKGRGLELGEVANPIALGIEIGGWTCSSSAEWTPANVRPGIRYRSPPLAE